MAENDDKVPPPSSHIATGIAWLILKNIAVGLGISLLFVATGSVLNVSSLGILQGLYMLIVVFTAVAGFGIPIAATRFSSFFLGAERRDDAYGIYGLVYRIGLILSLAVAILVFFLANFLADILFHQSSFVTTIQITSVDIFLFSMITYSISIYYSLHKFRTVAIILTTESFLKITVAIFLLLYAPAIESIILGFVVSDFIIFIFCTISLREFILRKARLSALSSMVRYSLPLFVSQISQYFSVNMDYYFLLAMLGTYVAGTYTPAVLMGTMLLAMITGIGETLLPYFSRIYGKSGGSELNQISRISTRYIFLYFFPVGFLMFSLSPIIIYILLNSVPDQAIYSSLLIILTITLTSVGGTVFNYVLMSGGRTSVFLYPTILAFIVQIIVSFTLIPHYGTTAAAFSRSLAYIVMFIYLSIRLKQLVGLYYDSSAFKSGLIGSILLSAPFFYLNLVFTSVYLIPVTLLGGLLVYLIFLRLTKTITLEDLNLISTAIPMLNKPVRMIARLVIVDN